MKKLPRAARALPSEKTQDLFRLEDARSPERVFLEVAARASATLRENVNTGR